MEIYDRYPVQAHKIPVQIHAPSGEPFTNAQAEAITTAINAVAAECQKKQDWLRDAVQTAMVLKLQLELLEK